MLWYSLYRPAKNHIKEFNKEKLSWGDNPQYSSFCLLPENYYVLAPAYIMTGNNLKYLLSIMNTKLSFYYLASICPSLQGRAISLKLQFLEKLPIPKIDEENQQPFIKLVDEILESKQKIKDYKVLLDEAMKNDNFDREIKLKKELETLENICISNEKTIDEMVYKLYDLTEDEIKIVEGV